MQKKENKIVKYILIGICVLFLFVMLVLPLCYIVSIALGSGIKTYLAAITDKYTLKAMKLISSSGGISAANSISGCSTDSVAAGRSG